MYNSSAASPENIVPTITPKITPFLWFDSQAEQAAEFYTSVFRESRIKQINRYGNAGKDAHGREAVHGHDCQIRNLRANDGGAQRRPLFKFNEAVSFAIACESQDEIDFFWSKLTEGAPKVAAAG